MGKKKRASMNRTILRIKKLLRRVKSPDIQLFGVFILISVLIWFIEKMKQNYTIVAEIPIECVNVPKGYRIKKQTIQPIRVMLASDGNTLFWNFQAREPSRVAVDVSRLRIKMNDNETWAVCVPRLFETQLQSHLPDNVNMKGILTDTIAIPLLTVKQKSLPVVVRDNVSLSPQHTISAPTSVNPDRIVVSGTNDIIDTMTAVYTKTAEPMTLTDTVTVSLGYVLPKGVETTSTASEVTYYVETYTEKHLDVPITAINVPAGYVFKPFPTTVRMNFNVGLSNFETVKANDFDVVADLQNIELGNNDAKIKLNLRSAPTTVQNISYSPHFVEYLLEKR